MEEQGLSYADLKRMARASIEHSFLPGESLWLKPDNFTRMQAACATENPASASLGGDCSSLLKSSEKATQQWEPRAAIRGV